MNTSFQDIFSIFLNKISDYNLSQLDDDELTKYCTSVMFSAIPKIRPIEHDLEDFDKDTGEFNTKLLLAEQEIIAQFV